MQARWVRIHLTPELEHQYDRCGENEADIPNPPIRENIAT
jgi:hypothetical protein